MNLKCLLGWFLILLAVIIMPCIALGQDKTGSTSPSRESSPSSGTSKQSTDSLKGVTLKNSNPANTEKNDASRASKGEILRGKVVYITDGDTLTLQVNKTQYKIRLLGIDAPEDGQPFSAQSKKALSDKIFQKTVQVTTYGQDIYGNTLGIVNIDGKNVNLELVKEGYAWHYAAYSASKTLANAEDEARKAKIGLWADENPISPWQWRRQTDNKAQEDLFDVKENNPNTVKTTKSPADQTQNYWLTTASNVRHNSKCRYYQKTKGRPCGPNEGTPCKICGG